MSVPVLIVVSGFICLEFGFPVAIGEFLAGIVGGQFVSTGEIPWLQFFSFIGLLGVMFLAGFEVDVRVLRKNLRKSIAIGLASFLFPYIIVVGVSLYIGTGFKQALVLATALSTTSLAMVYTILKDSNLLATDHGQIILGSAMVVDLASMLSLTLIFFDLSLKNLLSMLVLVAVLIFIRKIVAVIFRRYKGNRFEFELKFMLLLLLALGLISESAGVHAAVMAFLVGVIFSDVEREHIEIIEKLETVVFSLLAPIFFYHAGSLITFNQLTVNTLVVFLMFFLIAVVAKFFGTYFSLWYLYHRDTAVARYGGIVFNYRLSFGIVTGMYAFSQGIIELELLNIILLIVASSSIISVFLEKKLNKEICLLKAPELGSKSSG